MHSDLKRIFDYIDAHRDEYIERVQKFCRQPSLANTHEGIDEMVALVKGEMKKVGLDPREIPTDGNPVIYAEMKGERDKTVAFYNHYDVQPVDPINEWNYDPFSATIVDGVLYSRGAADNKDALACRMCAVDAILKTRGKLPLNIKCIYEGEEEIGSPSLSGFAEKNPDLIQADGYVWEGGDKQIGGPLELTMGVKGMIYVELVCRGAKIDAHSSTAAVVKNPMWRLVWALGTIKDQNENILIDGFYDKVRPISRQDIDAFQLIADSEDDLKLQLGVDEYLLGVTGDEMRKRLYYMPTANICGVESGYTAQGAKTVLPSRAMAKMDFRLVPDQEPDEILALLRKHLDKHGFEDIEIIYHSGGPAFRSPLDSDFAKSVMTSAEEVYGMPPSVYVSSPGSSPLDKLCRAADIPAVMFGPGNPESGVHAPNEHIYIEDYIEGIKMTAAVLFNFAEGR